MSTRTFMLSGLILCAAGCGSSPTAPSPEAMPLSRFIETVAFEYHYSASDTIDVTWQEAYHQWATAALGVSPPRRIVYNKYLSRAHMGAITGVGNTNGYADPNRYEIHTIWPRDNHEVVHLYSLAWGMPVALWTEGLAVAFQTDPAAGDLVARWSRVALDDHARQFIAQGRLVPIGDLLTTVDFRRFDPNVTYPEAGSFMKFVLATCGLEGVKQLYRGHRDDSPHAVRSQFDQACGRPIESAEADWRAMLAAGAGQ
jgi:hypothetical protein